MDNLINTILGLFGPREFKFDFNEKRPQSLAQATPTPNPQNLSQATAPAQPFKFKMGLKDYSFVRPQLEKLFEVKKNPPLKAYINEFIKAGETYGVDPRVLVSIANNESSLGTRYPQESFNPFGYLVNTPQVAAGVTGVGKEKAIWQGLRNAGFTSLPHAIDRLTNRFQKQPTANYQQFYQDPTFSNLQTAYNANPGEREEQLRNFADVGQYFQ